jgi:2-polyprenyl-3-methyl-5-hydroxy-6-metoxy-1,4-benzoquinol methylase
MKQWYQKLFSNYSKKYEKEHFTQGTMGEVDFIEKEINFNKNSKILDIGCGTGRHAIELTKRGYNVTGIDLSEDMINKARKNAKKEDIEVDFRIADARNLSFKEEFDLVIMICEGAFPLMETDEMNFQILKNSANALKNSGKLIFTTLNGLYPLFHSVKDFINSNSTTSIINNYTFNLMTFRDHYKLEIENDHGENLSLDCNERYYVPSEITWLLKSLNFTEIDIFSCKLGEFNKDPLTTEDYEMLVVAKL